MSIDICVSGMVPMVILSFANWSLKVPRRLSNCCWVVESSWYLGGVKESSLMVLGSIHCVVVLLMGICVKSPIGGSKCPVFIPFGKFTHWFELLMTKTCSVMSHEMSCTPSINLTSGSVYCDPMKQAVVVLVSCPLMETEIAPLCFGGMQIAFAMDTLFIPDSMSSV